VLCLAAILFPFISALSILEGVKAQSRISVEEGADIYVTMDMYGRSGVIPYGVAGEIEKVEGVVKAVPRVISRIYIDNRLAVLLGLPVDEIPRAVNFINGSVPGTDEIVLGNGLSEKLRSGIGDDLSIGLRIFAVVDGVPYIQKKVYRISGIFDSGSGIWTSDLILMDIDEAIETFEMADFVTDVAVYVRPGYSVSVVEGIQKMNSFFRIQTKDIARTYVARGFNIKGGIFMLLYTVAFAIAILALLVVSGAGLSERKREIGILKATGWQTSEVLEMVFFENIIISLIGASVALVLSFIWVRFLNGFFIAQIFIAEIGAFPPFDVPARFMPQPFMLSFLFALVLTMTGSIYTTWRASTVSPAEALR